MPLTEFQQEFLRNCSHRWNIKTGATRSGKTYLDCAVTIPKRICAARDEGLLVMLGNTLGTLERNVLEPMRALWGAELVGVVRTSAAGNVVQLFGRKVYVLGADNKKHIARIQGAAFEYAYGDEITTWDEGVFQMLKSRLSCPHSHFDGTCNPDNPQHWFKRFLDSDADIYCQAYTIDDNPTLPPEFVAQLKKNMPARCTTIGLFSASGQRQAASSTARLRTASPPTTSASSGPQTSPASRGGCTSGWTSAATVHSTPLWQRAFCRTIPASWGWHPSGWTPATRMPTTWPHNSLISAPPCSHGTARSTIFSATAPNRR